MKLKHTFRQHRLLLEKYLKALELKEKAHYQQHLHAYPHTESISLLKEQVQIFRNLEYIGTPTGEAPTIQANLFA